MEKVVSIFDKSFLHGSGSNNFLSIELSPGGFSYCILDAERFEYKVLESFSYGYKLDSENSLNAAEYLVQSNAILNSNFDKVRISYTTPDFVLIPEELYLEQNKEKYLEFNAKFDTNSDFVNVDKLNNLKAYSVYSAPVLLNEIATKYFPGSVIKHYATPLIESIMYNVATNNNKADLVLNLNNEFFEILIIENKKLKIVKAFNFVTIDDLMYYIFFTLENLGLSAENMNLIITGNVSMESDLYRNIKLYFKSVDFSPRNDLFKYSEKFENIPHHYFYTLINLNLCG